MALNRLTSRWSDGIRAATSANPSNGNVYRERRGFHLNDGVPVTDEGYGRGYPDGSERRSPGAEPDSLSSKRPGLANVATQPRLRHRDRVVQRHFGVARPAAMTACSSTCW
jgi:hypothetical protein